MRSIDEINDKISQGKATVWTIEELKTRVQETSITQAAKEVDVITTGTFEPMESSGAIINLGHTDPPIKIRQCWLDGVLAYSGFGAVDLYLGATQVAEDGEESRERGGGHVIEDLIAGKPVQLRALGQVTDCYPRASFETRLPAIQSTSFIYSIPATHIKTLLLASMEAIARCSPTSAPCNQTSATPSTRTLEPCLPCSTIPTSKSSASAPASS
jgi:Uncharacterized conserved protein